MVPISAELLKVFGFWGCILVLKMMAMALLTARQRFSKKVFGNPEDAKVVKGSKVAFNDPDVERVRRAHLNDLENIPIWFIVTFIWLSTGPSVWLASILIRTFVIARIVHTVSYVFLAQQPTRAIAFFVAVGVTMFEIVSTLMYFA